MGTIKLKTSDENIQSQESIQNNKVLQENIAEEVTQGQMQEETPVSYGVKRFGDNAVLFEDKTKRSENSKVFQLNNGTAKEIISNNPMHYFDEQEQRLRTIDNRLAENETGFESQYGIYKAEIAKNIQSGKTIKYLKGDANLEWIYMPKHSHAEGQICDCNVVNTESLSPSSNVKYENIEPNVDLEYQIVGNNVKENIIVREKQEEYKYSFKLKTNGLTLRLSEDNANIELYSTMQNEQGETQEVKEFTIPSPFMFDSNGEICDDVYYEIEPISDGEYVFHIVSDSDWLKEELRAFPITIDPQIITNNISYFTKQTQYRNVSTGSSSGTDNNWYTSSVNNIKVSKTAYQEYRTIITVKKSLINLLNHKIISAKIILKPYSIYQSGYIRFNGNYRYYSGGTLEQDITTTFNSFTNDFAIYLEPSYYSYEYSNMEFYATGTNAPTIEIEYITNENTKPTIAEFSLAGICQGIVNLATGEINSSIFDAEMEGNLSFAITHNYKKNSRQSNFGKNWRLNLEQKLEKNTNSALDANYVFTDELGDKHAFKDKYYYLNSSNKKEYIEKSSVVAELDGRLTYSGYDVLKEQKTATGLKAITEAEEFKNIDLIQQKSDEYKQLESQVDGYKNALLDFVVMDKYSGNVDRIFTASTFEKVNYDSFVNISSYKIILPKTEALQYKSLIKQKENLNKTVSLNDIVPGNYELNTNLISLKSSLYQLLQSLNRYSIVRSISGFSTSINNTIILNDANFGISDFTYYESDDDVKSTGSSSSTSEGKTTSSTNSSSSDIYTYGKDLKLMLYQRNLLIHQIVEAEANLATQKTQVNDQIDLICNKRDIILKQFKDYYREYKNKNHEFEQLKKQIPERYLVDSNNVIRAFNEYGNLVAIYDNNENNIIIEYDSKDKISAIYEGEEKKIGFEYNFYNQLITITDARGRKTEYTYSSTSLATANLQTVTYADGRRITINYLSDGSENISYIESSTINDATPIKEIKNQKTALGYTQGKLTSVVDYSLIDSVKKGKVVASSQTELSRNIISYDLHQTSMTDNKGKKTCYVFKNDGNVSMSYTMQDGAIEETYAYDYKNADCSYMAKPKKGQPNLLANFAPQTKATSYLLHTIQGSTLDNKITDYIFSAFAKADSYTTAMRMKTEFYEQNMNLSYSAKYELRADVIYPGQTKQFICSFDYTNKNKQYIALPITLNEDSNGNAILPSQINLYIDYSSNRGSCMFDTFTFGEAEWTYSSLDQYDNAIMTETSWEKISATKKVKSTTNYIHDNDQRVIRERTEKAIAGDQIDKKYSVTNYEYNQKGKIFRVETYIEGEESTKGIDIAENIYDKFGNKIKEIKYNSLDATTKFYSETDIGEKGKLLANIDETGENKTKLEYVEGTSLVKTSIMPNGSKFSYGYNKFDEVTGITQSTVDGEENSTKIYSDIGLVTELTSGLHKVNYEYDSKFRKTKVVLDDNSDNAVEYTYDEATLSNGYVDKTTTKKNGVATETRTDRKGNLLTLKVKDNANAEQTYFTNTFDDNKQQTSVDNKTSSSTTYTYDTVMKERLSSVSRTAGTNVSVLTETNKYYELGQLENRVISGAVNHTYSYKYKSNAGMDLETISLPNGLTVTPQNDECARSTGKILSNGNSKIYGEYLSYLKVGDHGTNTISTMRYGRNTANGYVINDSLKYKYDNVGNISEISENGKLQTKYTYDSINRLIREDNKAINKTYLFTYDNFGNILSKRETNYTVKAIEEIESFTKELDYLYNGNYPDRLTSFGSQSISYNGKGLPISYLGKSLEWSGIGQLTKVNGVEYIYDGYGKRIKKGNTTFTYDFGNRLIKQGENLEFYYDGNDLSGLKFDNVNYIYRKNAQGDITHILDMSGNIVVKYVYDAWSNHAVLNADGTICASGIGLLNPFRYRSYYYDTDTNLYFLKSRYYDPTTGRFISQDDESYIDPENINGLNLYAYCGNNPVMRIDPNGTNWWSNFWNSVGNFFSNPIVQIITTAVVIVGLGIATALTGGAAGVILGAAFWGAITGAASGAAIGAVTGVITGIATGDWSGMLGSITGGMMSGALIGGATGALTAGINIATGAVKIVGSAQKTGTFFHRMASNVQAGKMVMQIGRYSQITLDRSLNRAGLIGRKMPDVVGKARWGKNLLVEVTSKSQTYAQMWNKLGIIMTYNHDSVRKVISWAAWLGKRFF